ncbi:MAG TPA: aldo/keto reductase [Sphingomonadaceae bacterium]|nr:aldo/keto reductase [Sphingomonadaceae bacterium]
MIDHRPLGSSGLATPALILGGNVFGWTADEAASFAILDAFVEGGGVMIDTADVYSAWAPGHKGGESETVIGRWLERSGKRERVQIATKVGMMAGLAPERIAAACDASLRRLGVETIDLYYAHKDDAGTPLADTLGAFDALVRAGKVRALGASNYDATRLAEALDVSAANGLVAYSVLQPWYNMVERARFEGPLRDLCVARGIGVAPYYSLANGFLTGKYRSEADLGKSVRGSRNIEYLRTEKGARVLAALDGVAAETGATPAQIALAWTAAQPGITAPIASATGVAQLEELLGALRLELSGEQIAALDAASAD